MKLIDRSTKRARIALAAGSILYVVSAGAQERPVDVLALDFGNTATSFESRSKLVIEAGNLGAVGKADLEARLFRGSPRELLNNQRAVVIGREKCIIFESSLWPIRYAGRGKLDLGFVPPAGQWTLVFHKGRWTSDLIPIKPEAIEEYFRRAFVFTVHPERAEAPHALTEPHRPAILVAVNRWFRGGISEQPHVVYRVAETKPLSESDLERCFYIRTGDRALLRARLERCGRCDPGVGGASAGR